MKTTYDPVAKLLHWLVFILIATEFIIAWTMPDVRRGEAPTAILNTHFSVGILIIAIVVIRLLWRLTHATPALPDTMPRSQKILARATHDVLYLLLFIMPFSGWAWATTHGWVISFFGLIAVPPLLAGSSFGQTLGSLHPIIGVLLVGLIGLHIAASLYHHYIVKDDILTRMLPEM